MPARVLIELQQIVGVTYWHIISYTPHRGRMSLWTDVMCRRYFVTLGFTCTCLLGTWIIFKNQLFSQGDSASAREDCSAKASNVIISADDLKHFESGYSDLDNEQFLDFIRRRWLIGPPAMKTPRKLMNPDTMDYSQVGQSSFIDRLLMEKRNGFFVECGAANGETLSNTLFFEKSRGWGGLLVEANPDYFHSILSKTRKVYNINACLSTKATTDQVRFSPAGVAGGIPDKMDEIHLGYVNKQKPVDIMVTCFPIYAILKAIGQTHVDYFSLDVEGPELDILNSIPFNKITIDVLSIEYRVSDMVNIIQPETLRKLNNVRKFFTKLGGYDEVGILPWNNGSENQTEAESLGLDVIYKRRKDAVHRQ